MKDIIVKAFVDMIDKAIEVKGEEVRFADYMPSEDEFATMTDGLLADRARVYLQLGIARYFSANTAGGKEITKEKFLTYQPGVRQAGTKATGIDKYTRGVIDDLAKMDKIEFPERPKAKRADDEAAWEAFDAAKKAVYEKYAQNEKVKAVADKRRSEAMAELADFE